MGQRVIRRIGGLAACALAIALVVGPAAAALADGGPDRVASTQASTGERPGFGDGIKPNRPGFGDRLQPGTKPVAPAPAPVSAAIPEADGGWSTGATMGLVGGLVLVGGATALALSAVRRRHRLARA